MAQHTFEYDLLQYIYEILQGHNLITKDTIDRLAWGDRLLLTFIA